MTPEKESFLANLVQHTLELLQSKFRKGASQHAQSLDNIANLTEAEAELVDLLTYISNCKRVLVHVDELLSFGKIDEARELIRRQFERPVPVGLPDFVVEQITHE